MGKRYVTDYSRNSEYDHDYHENGYYDKVAQNRKLKRLKNIIRSKHLDELLDLEEDL